jgi:acyl-CoA reductase-like NAD-dependent aldehyde dehydrogenase
VAACDTPDVDAAVAAARAAFERGDWADQAPAERKRMLLRFAELVEQATQELALLETLDVGKPIRDSIRSTSPPRCAACAGTPRRSTRSTTRSRRPDLAPWRW